MTALAGILVTAVMYEDAEQSDSHYHELIRRGAIWLLLQLKWVGMTLSCSYLVIFHSRPGADGLQLSIEVSFTSFDVVRRFIYTFTLNK